jgi:hypothetical protein
MDPACAEANGPASAFCASGSAVRRPHERSDNTGRLRRGKGRFRISFSSSGFRLPRRDEAARGVFLLARFHCFACRPIGDARRDSLFALSVDNRDAADATLTRALAAGGSPDPDPAQDHGFMFSRSNEDPDGYVWEIMWMDAAGHAKTLDTA